MPHSVLVVGGAGAMGRWCAAFFKSSGFAVAISSRRDATDTARSMGVSTAGTREAGAFDIIVLSVPIDAIEQVSADVAPRMKPGALLMDLSSLKEKPVTSMLRHAPSGVEVIGTHPLFGPGTEVSGRSIVLVPTEMSGHWLPILTDMFKEAGYNVLEATAEQHDRDMAVVQGLTHFMYIALGRALEKETVDLKEVSEFKTPVFGVTFELLGRVLSQDPALYSLIQSSEYAGEFRKAYVDACLELSRKLDSGDAAAFARDFEAAARYYGDTEGARRRSERIVRHVLETEKND